MRFAWLVRNEELGVGLRWKIISGETPILMYRMEVLFSSGEWPWLLPPFQALPSSPDLEHDITECEEVTPTATTRK